jgi:hypothetical protein
VPVPLQAPPQPVKLEPAAAVAVKVTVVPCVNEAAQVAPQSIPAGELVTVPAPEPAFETVSVWSTRAKPAVTARSWSIVTVQVPVPLQAPPQPVKLELAPAVAVSVTIVPCVNSAAQVAPQSIPAGELVTVPEPVPDFDTVSVWTRSKVALTARSWSIVTVQVPVPLPLQTPPQPVKVELAPAVAVSVTVVPCVNEAEQVAPQSIPAGELVTVPEPVPDFDTVSMWLTSAKVALTDRS